MAKKKAKYTPTERRRHANKYNKLRANGFSSKDASKLSRGKSELSWANIDNVINYRGLTKISMGRKYENVKKSERRLAGDEFTIYTAEKCLTVLWLSFSGELDFMTGTQIIERWNTVTKAKEAKRLFGNVDKFDNGSGGADGIAKTYVGTKEQCMGFIDEKVTSIHSENRARKRNGEPEINEYTVIVKARDRWNADGIGNLLNTVMSKCTDKSAYQFYEDIADYCKAYLPEIYEMIF